MQIAGMSLNFHPFLQSSTMFTTENRVQWDLDFGRILMCPPTSFSPSRLGFLGLLHMEVFNQRLEQEYNASVILTTPTVPYKAVLSSAKLIKVYNIYFYFVSAWKGKLNKNICVYTKYKRKLLVIYRWIPIKSILQLVSININFITLFPFKIKFIYHFS